MENSYGISVKNKYDLFLETDDPLEIIREQERRTAAKKAEKLKKATQEKDAKPASKSKQAKPNVPTPVSPPSVQESKSEKSEPVVAPGKSDEKQKRQKPAEDNDSRLLKDRGNRQRPPKEETVHQEESEKLEIGTFDVRGNSGNGTRERRGGGRGGRGFTFRANTERSPRENVEGGFGGSERRPRRGGFNRGPRPNFSEDKEAENQENNNFEGSQFEARSGPRRAFFGSSPMVENGGESEERRDRQFSNNDERKGFFGRSSNGFERRRREDGENRGYGGPRRNYENRPPRRTFSNRQAQETGAEPSGPDENRAAGVEEPQQEVETFGHWGAENTSADETSGGAGAGGHMRARGRGGFGRGRARGRGRGGIPGGRREFSRRGGSSHDSGYGAKATDKRDGSGSHNWGNVMDDLEAQSEAAPTASWADQAEAADIQESAGNISTYEDESGAAQAPAEPEAKMMTLDEYKAVMEAKRLKIEFNIRKPGEGCSDDKWKKTYVLKKKEPNKGDADEEEEETEEDRHGKSKNLLPIQITFFDDRRGGPGGRGGFGGGGRRGSRGGGGFDRGSGPSYRRGGGPPRGGGDRDRRTPRENAPNVADEQDFPSLVAPGTGAQ